MKLEVRDRLSDARDFYALTKVILSLCEPFGPVHSFRFVHNRGISRVACFIELESAKQQPLLARELAVGTLNGAVCLEIQVRKDFGSPCKVTTLSKTHVPATEQRIAQLTS